MMTRIEFMMELQTLLQNLPETERQDALQYYEEYFDDAGPENEQAVIAELKSPTAVAARLMGQGTGQYAGQSAYAGTRSWQTAGNSTGAGYQAYTQKSRSSSFWIWLICLSPIWAPLLIGIAVTVLAFFIAVVALVFSLGLTVILLILSCLICLGIGTWQMFGDPLNGVFTFSFGLVAAGLGMMLAPAVIGLFRSAIPAMSRGLANMWNGLKNFFRR